MYLYLVAIAKSWSIGSAETLTILDNSRRASWPVPWQCDHGKPARGKWRGCLCMDSCEVNWAFLELLTLVIPSRVTRIWRVGSVSIGGCWSLELLGARVSASKKMTSWEGCCYMLQTPRCLLLSKREQKWRSG